MFNCGFYSSSVLHNADFRITNPHTCKTSSKSSKIDVAPLLTGWCEYYLILSSTQVLLSFVYTSL